MINFTSFNLGLASIPVYTDPNHATWRQIRFPRSKKARMRKKWRKQQKNWGWVPMNPYTMTDGCSRWIVMHPLHSNQLKKEYDS